jgi:hypothetical protein
MCSGTGTRALPRVGFPIRTSPGRRLFSTSPRLIAAGHVLHRLLAPRHPPMALIILTERTSLSLCSFQGSRRRAGTSPARLTQAIPQFGKGWRSLTRPSHGALPTGPRALGAHAKAFGSFKTEQDEAVRAGRKPAETGRPVVDIEF